jgi:hypothetical protein
LTTALARRLARLEAERASEKPPPFDAESVLFPAQLALVRDSARYRTAVCSRRAGKTVGCAAALILAARARAGVTAIYITLSRLNAKRILWRTLLDLNRDHAFGGTPNESELFLAFPNGSRIYLAGANDRSEIEKFRGMALALAVIDEAQSLPAYLEELVDAVLVPALMDYDGALWLIGTPGPVPTGYFHACATGEGWAHHSWTVFDNPHILAKSGRPPRKHLEDELKRRGIREDDPVVQREWFGRWVHDPNSLVFRFDAAKNTALALPPARKPWRHVIGIDLGYDDADAIVVLAFNEESPNAYQVAEWVGAKQSITELTERLAVLVAQYGPISVVWDTGGLGKKIADEVTRRTGIPLKAAEKARKFEYIELLNDALRTQRLFVLPTSRFVNDALLVEWDRDKTNGDRRVISDRFHSDIADALLYAFRESLHWLHEAAEEPPAPGTEAAAQAEAERMERAAEERLRDQQEEDAWGW